MRILLSLFLSYFVSFGAAYGLDHTLTLSERDSNLINKVTIFHLKEIDMASYALTLNLSNEDKNYARRVMKNHQESQRELSALSKDKHYTLPSTLPTIDQDRIQQLKKTSLDNFRMEYIRWSITSHEQALDDCEKLSAYSSDEDVRKYANETIVSIRHHIQMAYRLKQQR